MTSPYTKSILLVCVLLLCSLYSRATHIVGADMSYKNIGPNKFEFTLNIYRDCRGIPVQPSYKIDYSSLNCNLQGNFTVNMDPSLTKEISPICPGLPTICTGGTQDGIQQYVYKAVFTIPQACKDWVFSWRECNRNKAITTIVNPDAQCIYVESTLNNVDAPSNNSPTFNNPPVSVLCIGQLNYYNPGTAEQDMDNLTFSAITPRTGKFKDVVYLPSYSSGNPLINSSGYQVSTVIGDIIVNPSVVNEITVAAIKVQEYRNGVLIGSTMRDIQIITKDCNNNNPILSGIDKSTSDSISICAGKQVCFSVYGTDIDIGQNLTMSWNYGIDTTRAKFTITGDTTAPKGNFCWSTKPTDAGLFFFTVTVKDNFCPIIGTTTRSYKIRVIPSPQISLANPINIACNTTTLIAPVVTGGSGVYAYKWNTGAITKDITKGSGTYTIFVTDSKGCKSSAVTEVRTGVVANFGFTKVCSTQTVSFHDSSTSLVGTINSWAWNFGDPASGGANTSGAQNPVHTYTAGGIYNVTLTVTDNTGCIETITKKVKVCDLPLANFITFDSCQNKQFIYVQDKSTASVCGIKSIGISFGGTGGGYSSPPFPLYFPPGLTFPMVQPDTGMINLTYTITNEDGCVSTASKIVHVNPQPLINIVENNFFFDCSNPSTLLHAVITPGHGKPPYTIVWSNGTVGPTTTINAPGIYSATVTDARGCVDIDFIIAFDPILPGFYNDPYCELTDQVKFHDSTSSHWGLAQWDWSFGDGTTFSTTNPALKDPTHVYAAQGIYNVRLIVHDQKGCVDTASQNFVFILPDNHFVVQPSPFCIGQELTFESPRGLYVDSLIWNFSLDTLYLGRPDFQSYPANVVPPQSPDYYYFDGKFTYPGSSAGQNYNVTLQMKYNNNQCVRNYSKNISIFPAFDVDIDSMSGKQCAGDSLQFYASKKIGSPVISWKWNFDLQNNVPPYNKIPQDSSTLQNPKTAFYKNGNYFATLVATNADGCQEIIKDYGFSVVSLPKPLFCIDNPCVEQKTKFFYFCSNFPEVNIDSVHWSFGDGAGNDVQEPFHIYADSGLYNVKCEIFNTAYGCENDTTIPTRIYLLPVPDFIADPVCIGQFMQFKDLSLPSPKDTLIRWAWSFGDGGVFSTTAAPFSSPKHTYATTGTFQVGLHVESKISGCVDTIIKPVTVNPNPKAGFIFDENNLVSGIPIGLTDQSQGAVKWLWNFGDGQSVTITDSLNKNPEHTYADNFDQVTVEQIVYNQFGCTDTIRKTLKLGVHLVLPNAFSPNGDGNNDGFSPVYKGIDELLDFSVYDRWGQKIFDAEKNLKAVWDGTYKGKDQPIGVYVYYVKAKTLQGKEIALSGNVTLVR
jgi:gliding motility-associated-like protein